MGVGIYPTFPINTREEDFMEKNIKINFVDSKFNDEVITKFVKVSNDDENIVDDSLVIYEINIRRVREKYEKGEELSTLDRFVMSMDLTDVKEVEKLAQGNEDLLKLLEARKMSAQDPNIVEQAAKEEEQNEIFMAGYSKAKLEFCVEKNIKLARKMLDNNMDTNLITEFTGLTKDELEALK